MSKNNDELVADYIDHTHRTKEVLKEVEHKQRHIELHKYLDELVADYIDHTHKLPSKTTLLELMEWSHQQTLSSAEDNVNSKKNVKGE